MTYQVNPPAVIGRLETILGADKGGFAGSAKEAGSGIVHSAIDNGLVESIKNIQNLGTQWMASSFGTGANSGVVASIGQTVNKGRG